MPAPLVCYIRGLLQGKKITATALLRQFGYSHDKLTRFLARRIAWRKWYRYLVTKFFKVFGEGWIAIDDTVLAKPFGRKFPRAGWVYDSSAEKQVFGYNLVMVVWSNGLITLPLCWRWYRHTQTKIDLAQALLKEVAHIWHLRPRYVFMDAFYVANRLVDQLEEYGWNWVGRVKRNRIVNGCRIEDDLVADGDTLVGYLTDHSRVRIVKHDHRYLATNELSLAPGKIPDEYGKRWVIEETFRFLKQELHLSRCQSRSTAAQEKHLLCAVIGYLILQKEKQTGQTLYSLKERFIFHQAWGYNRIKHYEAVLLAGA